jgi:hypothetical protein
MQRPNALLKKIKFSADLNKSGPQSFFDSFWNEGKRVERSFILSKASHLFV